jgi:hypothetical protein
MDYNAILNGGMGLAGGIGAMPVAAPYTTAGLIPGAAMQFGGSNAMPYGAGLLGGAGAGFGAMAMQPQQPTSVEYAPFGGDDVTPNVNAGITEQAAPAGAEGMSKGEMFRMAAGALQGMGKNQQAFPSANTAQIIRDNNQFRFAGYQATPQQQMANALRNRG